MTVLEDRGAVPTVWRGPWFGWEEGRANRMATLSACSVDGDSTNNRVSRERGHTVVVSEGETSSAEQAKNVAIQLL